MRNKISGFTLIELMIAMIVASIGILAVSWILLLNQRSWKEGNAKLELQRDTYLAMLKIEYELRPARSSEIDVSDPTKLIIAEGKEFFLENGDLKFPNSDSPEFVVEGDSDTEFDVTISNVVTVNFTLVRGNLKSFITTSVMPRN